MRKFYNEKGEVEFALYDSVLEIPWFMEVAAKSEAYLEKVYSTNPEACSSWYLKYRSNKLRQEAERDRLET